MLNGSSGTLQDAFTLVVSWTVLSPATKRGFLGPLSPIVWGSEQCILILFKYALLCVCFFCGTTVPCFPTLHSAYVDLKSSGRKSPPPTPPHLKEVNAHPVDVMFVSQRERIRNEFVLLLDKHLFMENESYQSWWERCVCWWEVGVVGGGVVWKVSQWFHPVFLFFLSFFLADILVCRHERLPT